MEGTINSRTNENSINRLSIICLCIKKSNEQPLELKMNIKNFIYSGIVVFYIFITAWLIYPYAMFDKDWCESRTTCEDEECCLEVYR